MFFEPQQSRAEIQKINSILEAREIFNKADKDSLILFDIDYVLTQPARPSLQMATINTYKKTWKSLIENLSSLEHDILNTLVVMSDKTMLVENQMIQQIRYLQIKGVKVFALTGILAGPLGDINSVEKWRAQILRNLGFDFSKSLPQTQDITFSNLSQNHGQFPRFTDGIIYSNGDLNKQEKVAALKTFLELLRNSFKWSPKEIIMVDDREHNLRDVEKLCHDSIGIKFVGFHYQGAKNYPQHIPTKTEFQHIWTKLVINSKNLAKKSLVSQLNNRLK